MRTPRTIKRIWPQGGRWAAVACLLLLTISWPSPALAATPAWWNCNYGYRRQFTVSASAAVPNGYTVSLTFDHASLVSAGKSLASGNDLRVLYWTGAAWSELDRLLDPGSAWNNGSTKIWFKTPASISSSSSDSNYYLYYGYSGSGSPPATPSNVFLFYDGFESGNFSAWDGGAGDYCPTGCMIAPNTSTVHTGTYSAKADVVGDGNPDWARVTKTITGQTGLHASTYVYIPSGYSSTEDISVLHFYTGGWTKKVSSLAIRGSNDASNFRKPLHGNWQPNNGSPTFTFASPALGTGAWHRLEQKVIVSPTSGRIEVWQDGVKSIDLSNQNTGDPATEKIDFTLFAIFWQNGAGGAATLYFDNNFLRLWVDPEPTTSLGSELANDCPPSGPSLCNWQYKRKLTFNNSAQAENLIDFPVLVVLNSSRINYSQTQDAGQDLRFYDADGVTQLAHEIEKWDESGNSYVWVKVPQIDASSSTDYIWMYYGNASAPDGQNKTAVWDGSFKMVHHLKETTGPHRDSTSNAKDSTVINVATQGSASGKINGADAFTGASGHNVDVDDASNALGMSSTDSITVEAWVKTSSTGSYQFVVNKKTGSSDWQLHVNDTGKPDFWLWDGTNQARAYGATVVNDNNWHYLVARWTDSSSEARIFIDGASSASGTNASFSGTSNTNPLVIGEEGDANRGYNFTGTIDEVRYSKTARSNAWIAAQYKSMTDVFITYGAQESNGTAVNYFTPDAAAAGMNVPMTFIGSICQVPTVTTSSSDVVVGPVIMTDAAGNVVTSLGSAASTIFFIRPDARPATGITVTVDGKLLTQTFDIVIPTPDPNVTSGTTSLTGRTKRGTKVLGGLTVAASGTLNISTADTDGGTAGNQGYLPGVILVKGDVNIAGTIDIKGQNGTNGGSACTGGDGGTGGPGGGGGGGGGVRDASCGGGPVTTNLGPLHDTYVWGSTPDTAYGSDTVVKVKLRWPATSYRQGWFKFDTSSITGTITSATLKLNVTAVGGWTDAVNLEIYEFTDNSWNESTTYNTRPPDSAFGAVLGTLATPANPSPTLLTINVTSYVLARRAAGYNVISFTARMAADANGGAFIDSKEGTVPPVLTIVSSAGGGATAAPGGAGMSGGGGGGSKSSGTGGAGGSGTGAAGAAASGTTGGAGGVVLSGATGGGGGTADTALAGGSGGGGGTGNPFGAGGSGGTDNGGVAGQGGGGGGASGGGPGGGGGGGFYTVGAQGPDTTDGGFGGNATGNQQLVPLAGGSGGGGGGPDTDITSVHTGGGGGGGGGAVLIYASGSITVNGTITAAGGNGASGYTSGGDGSGGGGGGSGGAIFLQSSQVTSSTNLLAGGGSAGTSTGTAAGGAGGIGRIRIDGLSSGSTVPGTAGSKFIGPVIDTLVDRTVKGRGEGGSTITLYVYDETGAQVPGSPYTTTATGASGAARTWTISSVTFPSGTAYLAVKQTTGSAQVLGPGRATKGLQIINWREVY